MPHKLKINAILKSVAEQVFAEGPARVDTKRIADQLKITVPALYYYWEDRETLINEAMFYFVATWCRDLGRYIDFWIEKKCAKDENLAEHYWHSGLDRRYARTLEHLLEAHILLRHTPHFETSKNLLNDLLKKVRATTENSSRQKADARAIEELIAYLVNSEIGISGPECAPKQLRQQAS